MENTLIKLNENRNYPYEGYFWIINNQIIGITSEVPHYNYEFSLSGKTHKNSWNKFSSDFLVDGKEVEFDYFPRGRVMVDPEYHLDGTFDEYTCYVFLDKCINNDTYKKMIIDYYNLDLPTIHRVKFTMLGERAGIDHYTCHNCKNENV
jgi:hypothetical protein